MQRSLKRYGRRKISESLKVGTGSPQPEESDEMIIERVLDKDIDAYELLVRRYSRFVFGIVAVRMKRADVADVIKVISMPVPDFSLPQPPLSLTIHIPPAPFRTPTPLATC